MSTTKSHSRIVDDYIGEVKNLLQKKLEGRQGFDLQDISNELVKKREEIYEFLTKEKGIQLGDSEVRKLLEVRFGTAEKMSECILYELDNSDRLALSPSQSVWLGVCGGIGKKLKVNPLWVRVFFVQLGLLLGIGLLLYFFLFLIMYKNSQGIQKFIRISWPAIIMRSVITLIITALIYVGFHSIVEGIYYIYVIYVGSHPKDMAWLQEAKNFAKILTFILGFNSVVFSLYTSLPLSNGWNETFQNLRNAVVALFVFSIFVDLVYILSKMIIIAFNVLVF
ncbi:MAG: PspC domain-containing protein [Candidatus Hydrogenedentes bacterium]|nr:PspC domain-containing protein [Candidatus Hydrogenedentota bacterium]